VVLTLPMENRTLDATRRLPKPALWLLAVCLFSASPATAQPDEDTAYHLRHGSIARERIVVLGRDLIVDGEAQSHAVALDGSVRIHGSIDGDVIVLDGDALLSESARVGGDVFVLGGRIEAADGAAIGGRSVAYPEASDLWIALIKGPVFGLSAFSPLVLGANLALLAFWVLVSLLLMGFSRRELLSTSDSVLQEPFYNFVVGLTGVAAMSLTAIFFSALSGALLGVPLLVLVAVIALVLRFWGMVAVFHALGEWLARRLKLDPPPLPLTAATYGLLALGVLKLLPLIGIWAWSIATFIGVGAALSTRLGRREMMMVGA
jgi:hypothetical protein